MLIDNDNSSHSPASPDTGCWLAWFDGTAVPNPGRIGVGVVLVAPDGRRFEGSRPLGNRGCNNEAELLALAEVLEMARAAGARRLLISGDSDFTVQHLQGWATTAAERLATLVATIRAGFDGFEEVRLKWIPRHRNGDADALSRRAVGLAPKVEVPPKRRRRR